MNRWIKKLSIFALVALLSLCVMVACSGDSTPADTTAETTGDTTVETTAEATTNATEADTQAGADETTAETTPVVEDETVAVVQADNTKYPDMAIAGDGYDIYQMREDQDWGYRYGVTYLYEGDVIHAYFAAVGSNGEWDWITYKNSTDGGATWTEEKVVLTPTKGSMDFYSNCDPGVVYFGGYYYLGYTSTLNSTGACNNVFVARSKNPDGPFEKWNGSGWGGYECQPIFYYDQEYSQFGIGEPSFVELNGTLYVYYSMIAPTGSYTMVATADATDENWPATLQNHGVAVVKETDSIDIKYVEEWGKFIGIATGDRMTSSSWLAVFESNDGLRFELADVVRENTYSHLHNAGISSRQNGHINLTEDADKLRVIYAYGAGWGTWNTRVQPITLTLIDKEGASARMTQEKKIACLRDPGNKAPALAEGDRYLVMVRPDKDVYEYPLEKGTFYLSVSVVDAYMKYKELPRREEGVTFSGYDESIISIGNNLKVTINGVGMTPVIVSYQGLSNVFWVNITEKPENTGSANEPVDFVAVKDTYYIYFGERNFYRPQLRAQILWANGTFTEYYVDSQKESLTFTGYDQSIIKVSATGIVSALKKGETNVTISCRGMTCTVKVVVTDDKSLAYYNLPEEEVVMDYSNLDFTIKEALGVMSSLNSTAAEMEGEAVKLTVTGTKTHDMNDPQFYISYDKSLDTVNADDYDYLEITYKVTADSSSYANRMQIFIMTGDITTPQDAVGVGAYAMAGLTVDGEYHTLRIKLSDKTWWTGKINGLRIDYFDYAVQGDTMYITNIKLVKE